MRSVLLHYFIIFVLIAFSVAAAPLPQSAVDSLSIVSLKPAANQVDAPALTVVSVSFSQPVNIDDFSSDSFLLYGERAGFVPGTISLSDDSLTLTLTPDAPLLKGDRMTAILTRQPSSFAPVLQNGFVWEFDVAPGDGRMDFVASLLNTNLRLTSIAVGDFNGDDIVDLALTGDNGIDNVLMLAYLTSAGLVFGDSLILPDRVRPLYVSDLNRDGTPDFVLLHRGRTKYSLQPRISICHLSADGVLSLEETFTVDNTVSGRSEPRSAAINDFNADGYLDIIVQMKQEINPKSAFVYLNDKTGHFYPGPGSVPWFDGTRNAESIFDRDLNGNGFVDVGLGHTSSFATVVLHLNDGTGDFNEADQKLIMLNRDLENAKSLDFNGDLWPDVALADFSGSDLLVYDWQDTTAGGNGVSEPVFNATPRVYSTVSSPNWLDYGDMDQDGDLDLLLTGSSQDNLQVLLNNGGDFTDNMLLPIASFPTNFAVGDVNDDGALDIVVADTTGRITILYNNIDDYVAPEAPLPLRPANDSFISIQTPEFEWTVPSDANTQDSLHFRISFIFQDGTSTFYDSREQPHFFVPQPPLPQGTGTVSFTPPLSFVDGTCRWFVEAWDGMFWSEASAEQQFTIDTTPPLLHELNFPTADFAGKWFALADGATINAELTFTEMNPDNALLTTNGIGGPFYYSDLPAGVNVSTNLEFLPDTSPDGEYTVSVELVDKAALVDTIENIVGVDRNPPGGTTASASADTSSTLSFRIFWGGGSDGSGSGLSGAYRLQYRQDGGPWTVWIDKAHKSDSLFTGVHNSLYEFEAAAFDNVGYIEPFTNTAETSVFVDKYADDDTPPPAPVNLRANGANPSPWQKTSNYTIRWDLPGDDSGIKQSFWKLGTAPSSNDDYDDSGGPLGPAEAVVEQDGETPFYVWLSDSAGNVDYQNAGLVNLRRDSTLPVIHDMGVKGSNMAPVIVDGVPWFDLLEEKYFTAQVDYSEIHAENGILTTDGLTDSLINGGADLARGENVTTLFSFAVQSPADRVYTLKSTIIDSADNKASRSMLMGLDGHSPQGSLASAPAISDTLDFVVSWSAGDDGTGSGVATYDLYYRINENSWQFWFTADSVGSAVFHGQNGFEYRFESVAKDYLGHAEERSVSGETTVLVDLAANDKEPPPPPIDLTANGVRPISPWTNDSAFIIAWRKPVDLSGVVASYWKLGAPPASNADTTGTGPAEGTMTVHVAETGKEWLYLWLIDAKGNVDFHNADSVLLRFDNSPPRITQTTFLDAQYGEDWYHPGKKDSAHFEVVYREQFAAEIKVFSEVWNYDIIDKELKNGIGVKKQFSLDLGNRNDGVGQIVVTLTDSAGNSAQVVDTLRLDKTPPSGSTASSPAASGSPSFQVSWSPGEDAGVGVSDTFDVYVKVDEQGWLPWLTDYVGRTELFTEGQDKQTFHFEAVGRDWLGNVEPRTYVYETSTYVDVALSDSLPPAAPIDLKADGENPSPWRKTDKFQISWTPPQDPTGTPKGWFKLGEAPTGNSDTSGSFVGEPPIEIRATKENGQRLHIWLEDGAGNVDFRNYASVKLRYDASPPKIDTLRLNGAFAYRWYNPVVPPHKAVLDVFFSERNPLKARLVPASLFAPDSISLIADQDSISFELNFEGLGDADVGLKVTVIDSAGNNGEGTALLSLDRTPPRNTIAQSPDTTKPGEFTVSWDTSQTEEGGAGLSGVFDVRVQMDDGPWTLWKVRYGNTSALYVGEEGHKYAFEVAAYDNVGNREEFQSQAETTTWVITEFVDDVPPDSPIDIKVNGLAQPQWSTNSSFTINWTSPQDPSGIAKSYYKFDSPPADVNDFDGQAAGTPPVTIEVEQDGVRDLYLWLEDGSGNKNPANHGVAVLKHDGTPPQIISSVIANAVYDGIWLNPDSTATAQVRITYDELYPDSLQIFFAGPDPSVTITDLAAGEAQQVDALLSLQDVGDGEYPLSAVLQDSAGNRSLDSLLVALDSAPPQNAVASSPEQSVTGKFTISWAGEGAGADQGSGLSGEYDLRMRIGSGQWFEVLNREKTSSYTYVGTHGNRFFFEVAAWDNVGNREPFTGEPETSTLVDTAFVDQTPPDSPIDLVVSGKNPSPWQNLPDFLVTWKNPVDPSGISTVFYKLGSPPQSADDFTDSVVVDNEKGSALLQVSEEGAQTAYLWLKDGRGNSDFSNHASIVLRYDATVPVIFGIVPVSPVFGDNWYNQKITPTIDFDVIYREAHPDSLVLRNGLFHGLLSGLQPGGEEADTITVTIDMSDAPDGPQWLYAALYDSAGSVSNADSVQIFLDSAPPRLSVTQVDTAADEGTSVSVTATANDANDLQSVDLVFWQGGQRQRQIISMMLLDDSTYVADIPGNAVTHRGVEFLVQASDGLNTAQFPPATNNANPFVLRVRVSGENGRGLVMPQPLPSGTEENAYRLISYPLELAEHNPAKLLEPVFGPYDIKLWRFFYWDVTSFVFQEYPDIETITDGVGYWLITSKEDVRLHTGAGMSVNTIKPYVVILKKGWNDIGLPFNFPVDWKDVIAASAVDTHKVQGPHRYAGRWFYPFETNILQPWQGYSIYADEDDISIVIPALEALPELKKNRSFVTLKKLDWAFEIKARNGESVDASNYFGCAKSATSKWDYGLDYVEAPEIGAYVSLYFPHPDWELTAERYTTDFRPPQKGHVWDFEVVTRKTKGDIRLSFRPVTSLPNSLRLHLLDSDANMKIDLTSDSVYTFQLSSKQTARRFKIFAGDDEFMQEHEEEMPKTPTKYELVQNYPNPFNSSTIISYQLEKGTDVNLAVYNLLAQKVRQLQIGWQEKGFYQIRWDARDDQNIELGTGVYILRLETPEFTSTRKMVFMR